MKELQDVDDSVLPGYCWEKVEKIYARWKKAMMHKGLTVNVKKRKAFSAGERKIQMETSMLSL